MAHKGHGHHYNPFPNPPASSASEGTGKGSHLSRLTHQSSGGQLCLHRLQGPEPCPLQSLLGNQSWDPLPEKRIHQCWWGQSAKAWGYERGSRKRTTVGCTDTTEGTGVKGYVTLNAPRRNVVCLGNEVSLLSSMQGVGPPLPHTAVPASVGTGGTPTRASAPQSVATACWSPPQQATRAHPNCGHHTLPQPEGVSVPQSTAVFTPFHMGWNRCLRVAHM